MNDDSTFYEQALREADEGHTVPAVWAKAFSDADGDANRAKARYIKLRVVQLQAAVDRSVECSATVTEPPPSLAFGPRAPSVPVRKAGVGASKAVPDIKSVRRVEPLTTLPNVLLVALCVITLATIVPKRESLPYAIGEALGVCSIPLVIGLTWNLMRGKTNVARGAKILRWIYIAVTSLFIVMVLVAQLTEFARGLRP